MTREDHDGHELEPIVPVTAAADEYTQASQQSMASATPATAAGQVSGGGSTRQPTEVPEASPSVAVPRHLLGGSSRADLQRAYRWRYVELQSLPESFPDDGGRLRARLQHGWTRGWLVDVGPALNGSGALFEAGPWALVHFEQPDADGIEEELLPLAILQVLAGEGRVDPATAIAIQPQVTGQMRALLEPLAVDQDARRGGAHG